MPNSKVNDQWVSLPFGQLFREVGLYDMWRKLHLEENVYTCYSKTHNTLSEIELDLYSADFISYVLDVSIKPRGEKRLGTSEDTRNPPPPPKEGEQRTPQPQDVEGGEVEEVVEIVTTGDVHVVEEQAPHFTSASAQILIQEIMVCSWDLDIIKQKNNEVKQKLKNMIDVLGTI
ncbi:hypothetical protein AB205_0068780 [Aquarana catesbeiana]|uniref:Uncharacterized protein n=1 Tax=Aquarana catesbeiana TaxID=8400 RepID=A0A2G9R449_AQUCT|nr:hypothetical protein AB205_0068780 [Aquarana catesbeiana]